MNTQNCPTCGSPVTNADAFVFSISNAHERKSQNSVLFNPFYIFPREFFYKHKATKQILGRVELIQGADITNEMPEQSLTCSRYGQFIQTLIFPIQVKGITIIVESQLQLQKPPIFLTLVDRKEVLQNMEFEQAYRKALKSMPLNYMMLHVPFQFTLSVMDVWLWEILPDSKINLMLNV